MLYVIFPCLISVGMDDLHLQREASSSQPVLRAVFVVIPPVEEESLHLVYVVQGTPRYRGSTQMEALRD